MDVVLELPALTGWDVCDRCGFQAGVSVLLAGGGELLLCEHHEREHWPRLEIEGARVSRGKLHAFTG